MRSMNELVSLAVGEVDISVCSQHRMHFVLCVEQWGLPTAIVDAIVLSPTTLILTLTTVI